MPHLGRHGRHDFHIVYIYRPVSFIQRSPQTGSNLHIIYVLHTPIYWTHILLHILTFKKKNFNSDCAPWGRNNPHHPVVSVGSRGDRQRRVGSVLQHPEQTTWRRDGVIWAACQDGGSGWRHSVWLHWRGGQVGRGGWQVVTPNRRQGRQRWQAGGGQGGTGGTYLYDLSLR